jgi:hypothetical protein
MSAKRLTVITAMLATACWFAAGGLESAGAEFAIKANDVSVQPDPLPVTATHAEQPPGLGASSMTQADGPVDTNAAAGGPPVSGRPWRNSLGMEFVPVPGTNVLFCKWETRVQDYAAFVRREGRKWLKPNFEQGPTHPAVNVTWDDAHAFCQWLTEREQKVGFLPVGHRYRLPTDLEWSAAAGLGAETGETPKERDGGIKGVYPWGGPWPPPPGAGNYAPSREVDQYEYTAPVGSFPTNQYGIFDLGGNVWEWCEDVYDPGEGGRTLRGGSWFNSTPWHLASSGRNKGATNFSDIRVGFRVVLELPVAR